MRLLARRVHRDETVPERDRRVGVTGVHVGDEETAERAERPDAQVGRLRSTPLLERLLAHAEPVEQVARVEPRRLLETLGRAVVEGGLETRDVHLDPSVVRREVDSYLLADRLGRFSGGGRSVSPGGLGVQAVLKPVPQRVDGEDRQEERERREDDGPRAHEEVVLERADHLSP